MAHGEMQQKTKNNPNEVWHEVWCRLIRETDIVCLNDRGVFRILATAAASYTHRSLLRALFTFVELSFFVGDFHKDIFECSQFSFIVYMRW